jgi:transcriptional regulator with XRE-family HTH domain
MKTLGERIRQAREYRKLTGEQLAEAVGYKTQSGIGNLENRATGRGGFRMPAIAAALQFPLDWFLNGPDVEDLRRIDPLLQAQPANTVREEYAPYRAGSPADRVTALLSQLDDAGMERAVEYLELLQHRYRRPSTAADDSRQQEADERHLANAVLPGAQPRRIPRRA